MHAILSQNLFFWNLRCFVAKPVLSRFTHFLCGDKLSPTFCPWRKKDKYNVWSGVSPRGKDLCFNSWVYLVLLPESVTLVQFFCMSGASFPCWGRKFVSSYEKSVENGDEVSDLCHVLTHLSLSWSLIFQKEVKVNAACMSYTFLWPLNRP